MIISLDNLRAGLEWWRSPSNWGDDVMNSEYDEIFRNRACGVQSGWWNGAVGRLGRWHAYRGPKSPNTRVEIEARGAAVLERVDEEFQELAERTSGEPCIADHTWEEVEPLYSLAYGIKRSPVFAGKMCHFLLPNLFVVMDNWAVDASDYEVYWRGMRDAWCSFPARSEARKMLVDAIKLSTAIHPLYPLDTKIIELCHIGRKHPNGVALPA